MKFLSELGYHFQLTRSPPSRGAWIEMAELRKAADDLESPPSRGAWIEIKKVRRTNTSSAVAPLAGGVD